MIAYILIFNYFFWLNVASYVLYAFDKYRAVSGGRRISERTLLLISVLGGAYGAGCAMLLYRHKTMHGSFRLIVPLSFFLWATVIVILCRFAYLFIGL